MKTLFLSLYLLVVAGLLGSVGFAAHQNWTLRLETVKQNLARQAGMANFVVASAISHANKSLDIAQELFLPALQQQGELNPLQAHAVLQKALKEFKVLNEYSSTQYQGLMLYLDARGVAIARTDLFAHNKLDLADRHYFQRLSHNPRLERAIGPLVQSRTTGEWVFHVAVPLRDHRQRFQGVLVQQIRAIDIARELARYLDTTQAALTITQYADSDLTFIHPLSLMHGANGQSLAQDSYADHARRAASPQDAFLWPLEGMPGSGQYVVGYEHSALSGLMTTIHLPLQSVWLSFLRENLFLFSIAGLSLVMFTLIFQNLYRTSIHLTEALHDASSDPLTQLPNRRAFEEVFPRLMRDALRSREPVSVLFIDIDHFKLFNDDYGHDGGDLALQAVARTLGSCAVRPLDFLCRWGGEEFVVILPRTPLPAARRLSQKMLDAVRAMQLHDTQGQPMRTLTISIGITSATLHSMAQAESLVSQADAAMQAAKRQGRDRWVVQQGSDQPG